MVKHVMRDGTKRDSIQGYVVKGEIASTVKRIMEQMNERENKENY